MTTPKERSDALIQWVEEAGGCLHPSVEVYHDAVTKGSFRVKDGCTLNVGESVVTLPISRSLSYLNAICGHPDFPSTKHQSFETATPESTTAWFPAEFLREVPPHVVGRFVLMREYLRGAASAWWPYLRTLPQPEHVAGMLPALWPADDVEFLVGTNAYVAVQEIKATLKKEYKQAAKLLPADRDPGYTRPLYLWAYAIFTSRSFRPSLIIPDADALALPCEIDDFSVLLPLYDVGNHSPVARTAWRTDSETLLCRLISGQACESGSQVFNNYGMKTNAELLLGYGFVLPETEYLHNDYVHVRTKATDDDDLAGTHLVSLRPLTDPTSVVGRSKRLMSDDCVGAMVPQFAHIQDSLVTSLYEAITRGAAAAAGEADSFQDTATMDDIMTGRIAPPVKDRIVQALGSKLAADLDVLEEVEVPTEGLSANQRLAAQYRAQCVQTLENALRCLASDD
ncbi:SET domain-containing protein [Apiospora kogelbergensis]|uniref:SET domain-containing protein n=1 Tax=Apiospora kogelbergensis TaxID=1337665 RepID=UPI00312D33C7